MELFKNERIKYLKKDENEKGNYIIYWMQECQRVKYNFSLNKAIELSKQHKLPIYVIFNYLNNYPEASKRHYKFMLQGLKDVRDELQNQGIKFILLEGDIFKNICNVSRDARFLIWDKSYLKFQRDIKEKILFYVKTTVIEVENNVLVPVEKISSKEEYSAKTLRDKYNKIWNNSLEKFLYEEYKPLKYLENKLEILDCSEKYIPKIKLELDGGFIGGEKEALKKLNYFITNNLKFYLFKGPDNEVGSRLSPYLHFGQISPLQIVHEIEKSEGLIEEKKSFLEEVIIRRELAINFVYYNKDYDIWGNITYNWAYETLKKHLVDKREYLYTEEELESGRTHDIYWNSCQNQLVLTGYMESYMRMYWCKKILEWNEDPKIAYEVALRLNNKYLYDGRDPNSYAGIAWCFGKHDRPWKEREIFGKVRYMNSNGLERKFKMLKYIEKYLNKKGKAASFKNNSI